MLLAHGALVDAEEVHENTPLMYAVHFDNPVMIEDLLAHGADCNLQNEEGDTVFDIARKKGYLHLIGMFDMPFDLMMP